ncbi:hypothetical protein [Natrialbaceae archaeon AArc-T1-2]|uniref:hypothetical protein n=1 Tax=Natrialbaceae archaeon AArc-T1-2 TaxID=3053904 RepID=UPI0031F32322
MSDSDLTDVVTEEVTNQLDVGDLLGDGSLEAEIDTAKVGASVGREFGERLGRELGREIGREAHATIAEGFEQEKRLRAILADLKEAVLEAIRDAVRGFGASETVGSLLRTLGDDGGLGEQLTDAVPTGEREDATEDAEAAETEDETGESDAPEPDADTSAAVEAEAEAGDADDQTAVEDLENLRRETLEDFLEVMSYEDLQSVAKDVGVKANLSREEMTDRIVETVTEES